MKIALDVMHQNRALKEIAIFNFNGNISFFSLKYLLTMKYHMIEFYLILIK